MQQRTFEQPWMCLVHKIGTGLAAHSGADVDVHVPQVVKEIVVVRSSRIISPNRLSMCHTSEFGRDRRAGEVDECNGRPSSNHGCACSTDSDDNCRGSRIVLRERISERICEQIVAVLVRIRNKLRESVFFFFRAAMKARFCADTARSEFLLCNMLSCGVVVPILLS